MTRRGVHHALRLARTIANLSGEEHVSTTRLCDARQHRVTKAEGS
jgi:predicted ATPase with chaperone activity